MNPMQRFIPGLGQPLDFAAMAAGQGFGGGNPLADALAGSRQQNTLAAAPTLGNPQAQQAQQADLAAMMEAYKAAQGQQQMADYMSQPEYVQNSGALGALAMLAQAGAARKLRKEATETASDYASRIFAEEQRMSQEQAAAAQAAKLAEEQRAYERAVNLEREKGNIRNQRIPESVRALEVLAQRPDLAQLDLQRKAAGAARTTVNTGSYQRPFETALAKADATAYSTLRDRAGSAQQALSAIDAIDSILTNVQTGKVQEGLAMAGQYFGTEAGASFQATNALVQDQVVQLMGALNGPATDQDAARIEAQIPNMGTDPRARKVVFDYLRKKAGQQVETFQDADTFLRERGNLQGWVPKYGNFSIDASPLQSGGGGGGAAQPSGTPDPLGLRR